MRPIHLRLKRFLARTAVCLATVPLPAALAGDATPPEMSNGPRFIQTDGAALYRATCQGCHMPDGEGAKGAGMYPALAGNPQVATSAYVADVVLQGRNGMPGFGDRMSDDQVAAVVNYVRTHFGNQSTDALSGADVAKMR
jgi:mono/diheme cytochrome c family protein